jgi:hypothetical protein
MTDLHEIQRQIVAEIERWPVGSVIRGKLMDAADHLSLAIEAEACVCVRREDGPEGCGLCNETGRRPMPEVVR